MSHAGCWTDCLWHVEDECWITRSDTVPAVPQVLPAYLNALSGKGVHVVTVNDYLAKRDSEWVGQIHRFLGLDVGLVQQGLDVSSV